ncbi:MAG: HNH endonuclease, partial [Eubacteriaceae bacterium]
NAVGNENSIANGDGMGYKGGEGNLYSQDFEIPEDILKTKPQNSRIPKGWFDIGGKISVDKNNTWTYIGSQNQTVTYNNNYADFKGSGYVKQEVNIGEFKSRPDDCRRANKLAPNGPKSPDSVWHHNEDEQTMQEINKIIHEMFTHKGGFSKMKKNK